MKWLLHLLYGTQIVRIPCAYPLQDCVANLRGVVHRFGFRALFVECAIGRVSPHRVTARRAIPFVGNSFAPQFVGSFEHDGTRVTLVGRVGLDWGTRIFMSFWLGFAALMFLLSIIAAVGNALEAWWGPLATGGLFAFGAGSVWFGRWLARHDAAWLEALFSEALGSSGTRGQMTAPYRPIE